MRPEVAYFFADAHLGTESVALEAHREARLRDFLRAVSERATRLYIMGDLFDFWFEYRTAIPRRFFEILGTLRDVRDMGVQITYLAGNHDFWLGTFMTETLGIHFHDGALPLTLQGRRLWLHHGDGLVGGDIGYRLLKKVLRNPMSNFLYRCIHPDLGIPFAHYVSRWSRRTRGHLPLSTERLVREIAAPRFAEGYDAVLIGHFHRPYELRENGRDFVVLGDWIDDFSYAVLEDGRLRVETWPDQNCAANEKRWVSPRSSFSGT
jgi:UDP-2,3-diacylglucosamine hydrolase